MASPVERRLKALMEAIVHQVRDAGPLGTSEAAVVRAMVRGYQLTLEESRLILSALDGAGALRRRDGRVFAILNGTCSALCKDMGQRATAKATGDRRARRRSKGVPPAHPAMLTVRAFSQFSHSCWWKYRRDDSTIIDQVSLFVANGERSPLAGTVLIEWHAGPGGCTRKAELLASADGWWLLHRFADVFAALRERMRVTELDNVGPHEVREALLAAGVIDLTPGVIGEDAAKLDAALAARRSRS